MPWNCRWAKLESPNDLRQEFAGYYQCCEPDILNWTVVFAESLDSTFIKADYKFWIVIKTGWSFSLWKSVPCVRLRHNFVFTQIYSVVSEHISRLSIGIFLVICSKVWCLWHECPTRVGTMIILTANHIHQHVQLTWMHKISFVQFTLKPSYGWGNCGLMRESLEEIKGVMVAVFVTRSWGNKK
jgi:hypothetical protein